MNPKSVAFLRDYNDWRRAEGEYAKPGAPTRPMPHPADIGEAIDWACEQVERMQWQPIETAPRDGTNLLLVNHKGNMAAGLWQGAGTSEGWWLRGGAAPNVFFNGHHGPTHWMPLPSPPGETK